MIFIPLVFEKSFEKLQAEALQELTSSTNITRTTPGSKARSFLQVVNRNLNRAYQDFDVNFMRSFLPYAQGRFLDYLGDMLNVPRLGSSKAVVSSDSEAVKVFVSTGTFGSLNSGNSITIPIGTILSSLPGNEGITYRITESKVLPSGSTEMFLSAEAISDGSSSNVGPDTLKFSSFSNYTAGSGLKFSNVALINTARDLETDSNYRFRISNQALSAEAANETAVRLSLLVVPGVGNVISIPYARGIGTFDYLIQTVVPNTPVAVINACQFAISRVQGHGISGRAIPPTLTGMSFNISITWKASATSSERAQIKRQISAVIQDYINNLAVGEEFIYNELIQRVMDVSDNIKNIGTAQQAIDGIFIYRESKLQDNQVKEELDGDYIPEADERLIIEESVQTPIVLTDKN